MTSGHRCAACKCLRRRCASDCIFSPYFPVQDPQKFACIHKIHGASNVARLLRGVPPDLRAATVDSLHYEAQCRIENPVYGCAGVISNLQEQIHVAENQLAKTRAEMAIRFAP